MSKQSKPRHDRIDVGDEVSLLRELSRCLRERDIDALTRIEIEVMEELQPNPLTRALLALIDAIREAIVNPHSAGSNWERQMKRNTRISDALRLDLLRWLDSRGHDDQDVLDEADVELESALLREGILSPDDVVESFEQDGDGVVVTLDHGATIYLAAR